MVFQEEQQATAPRPERPLISIVTVCNGRLHHLQQTLPTMLGQDCPFPIEVVVVDFACPQQTFHWCQSLDLKRLVAVQVDAKPGEPFNLNRSRNCGVTVAQGEVIALVDADIRLDHSWLTQAAPPLLEGRAGLMRAHFQIQSGWDRSGTCLVSRRVFHQVRGYDEGFPCCWGPEEPDLYARCREVAPVMAFPGMLLSPIKHGHGERMVHSTRQNIFDSARLKAAYLRTRTEPINPHGFGLGVKEVFRGEGTNEPAATWSRIGRLRRSLRRPSAL